MREHYKVKIPLHFEAVRLRDIDREIKKVTTEVVLYADSHHDAINTVHSALVDILKAQLEKDCLPASAGITKEKVEDDNG